MILKCGVCEEPFEAERSTRKYCGDRCRQLAKRKRDAASRRSPSPAAPAKKAPAKKPESGDPAATRSRSTSRPKSNLVAAVRKELTEHQVLDTVAGQIALTYAIEATAPEATAVAGLLNGLQAAMEKALAGSKKKPAASTTQTKNEVAEARRKRDQKKARQAAHRA